jgi:hypothetical protein
MRKGTRLALAAALFFNCLAASKQAPAATGNYTCTPSGGHQITNVLFDGSGLYITCGGTSITFYAKENLTCGRALTTIDVIKIWESLATTAFLSGKSINIWWNDACADAGGGRSYITSVSLQAP